ncbi:hypothetical protein RB3190 [Rhodopirellula baltica SH 1]|uniref:Uncharacterized protein n=1 Tax=Rhodopirellula baltica (strain DSM 10527 / NCIMB 13988 / SH1) TaxID=243090 RepID=Q7UUN4_RHOBA|nr:hypothetical protein RB3190 [Rhodopirellula baltica SH 1]
MWGWGKPSLSDFESEVWHGRLFWVRNFPAFLTLSFGSQQSKRLDRTIALTWTFRQSLDSLLLSRWLAADWSPMTERN